MRPGPPDRVVVTGVGAVSAWGWGRDALWSGLCSGKTAIQGFSRFDHRNFRTHVAAQVPPPPDELPRGFRGWRRWCWAERFGAASVAEALNQAGLPRRIPELNAADEVLLDQSIRIFVGTINAGSENDNDQGGD